MRYTVEVARPVWRRTERYAEGSSLDEAVRAAHAAAESAGGDDTEEVRGKAFVAAMLGDGEPVEVPYDYTELATLTWAARLARFEQGQNVLGSEARYDGRWRVRAGCARQSWERTTFELESEGADAAARHALGAASGSGIKWQPCPDRAVPVVLDLRLVRGPDDTEGETTAVPDAHGPLRTLRGYTSELARGGTPQERYRAAREDLKRYVAGVGPGPSGRPTSEVFADLDALRALIEEARAKLGETEGEEG